MIDIRALQDEDGEVYRRNAPSDRENLKAEKTTGGVEAGCLIVTYKILSQNLFCILAPLATTLVDSYQAGLVRDKSTTDQIFALRQILQMCQERQAPTHHLFIDFKAAFDTIDRNELWNIMQRYHFLGMLIRL